VSTINLHNESPRPARTVAVVGASADRSKFSNKAVRACASKEWDVYPINPKGGTIEGLAVFTSIQAVPVPLDRVTMYLPPVVGMKALPSIAAVKPGELWVNPGAESDELLDEARRLGLNPIAACSIVRHRRNARRLPGLTVSLERGPQPTLSVGSGRQEARCTRRWSRVGSAPERLTLREETIL